MRLRAGAIVRCAVERAVEDAVPCAMNRWWKHREQGDGLALTASAEFRQHVAEHVRLEVLDELDSIIDFDAGPDDLAVNQADLFLELYQGGGGWRWALRGLEGILSTSVYHSTRGEAESEASEIARQTGLRIVTRSGETEGAT